MPGWTNGSDGQCAGHDLLCGSTAALTELIAVVVTGLVSARAAAETQLVREDEVKVQY